MTGIFDNTYSETTETVSKLPDWMQTPYKNMVEGDNSIFSKVEGLFDNNKVQVLPAWASGMKDGKAIPMNQAQTGGITALVDNDPLSYFDKAEGLLDEYTSAGSQYAGDLKDNYTKYMNPYLNEVLNPQLRELRRGYGGVLNEIGDQAHMANAFGDAAHGVEKGLAADRYLENVSDTTGKAYSDAFRQALASALSDLTRKESEANKHLTRVGTGAAGQQSIANDKFNTRTSYGKHLIEAGDYAQRKKQAAANYDMELQNMPLKELEAKFNALNTILGGIRYGTNTTTKTTQPDNTGASLLGSALGWWTS